MFRALRRQHVLNFLRRNASTAVILWLLFSLLTVATGNSGPVSEFIQKITIVFDLSAYFDFVESEMSGMLVTIAIAIFLELRFNQVSIKVSPQELKSTQNLVELFFKNDARKIVETGLVAYLDDPEASALLNSVIPKRSVLKNLEVSIRLSDKDETSFHYDQEIRFNTTRDKFVIGITDGTPSQAVSSVCEQLDETVSVPNFLDNAQTKQRILEQLRLTVEYFDSELSHNKFQELVPTVVPSSTYGNFLVEADEYLYDKIVILEYDLLPFPRNATFTFNSAPLPINRDTAYVFWHSDRAAHVKSITFNLEHLNCDPATIQYHILLANTGYKNTQIATPPNPRKFEARVNGWITFGEGIYVSWR